MKIDVINAWEVLDSRVEPTVRVSVTAGEHEGRFSVPAGASTGRFEAVEKRDGGTRFHGPGVHDAINNIHEIIAPELKGRNVTQQSSIDRRLVELDGRDDLSNLGANAVLGVSGAVAHTAASASGQPLHRYLSMGDSMTLPTIWCQILSGGMHAQGALELQDISVIPMDTNSFSETIEWSSRIYHTARDRLIERGVMPLVGDEGGFGMKFDAIDDAFEFVLESIQQTKLSPGRASVALALDVAASHFYRDDRYVLESEGKTLTTQEMVEEIIRWIDAYPIISLEDPLAEDDWQGWNRLTDRVGNRVQIVGDDLLVTNEQRLKRAIDENSANAILVKPNQTGTVSRTRSTVKTAKENGFVPVISARSGETADTTVAEMAVGWNTGQLKLGSFRGTERASKINRLLDMEKQYGYEYISGRTRFDSYLKSS